MATEVDITDSPSEDLLAVPAWYDPKKRRFIWDRGRTMRVGILIIGPDDLAYTTDEGVVFEAKLGQVQVHWSSSRFFHALLPRCDLHTQQGDYRL
jgi:hypothetical protein